MKRFLFSHIPLIDRIGIMMSGACMIHCLALPIILPLISVALHQDEESVLTHILFAVLIVPSTVYAAYTGYRKHHVLYPVILFTVGVVALLSAIFFVHNLYGELAEQAVTVFGGVLLIAGHLRNYHLQHTCTSECFTHVDSSDKHEHQHSVEARGNSDHISSHHVHATQHTHAVGVEA
jgi:hypothetical protein